MGNKQTKYVVSAKFKELTENVDFMEKVLESKTEKEVRSLFEKEGLILSDSDVEYLSDAIGKIAKKTGVMPEEELSYIAGGIGSDVVGAIGTTAGLIIEGANIFTGIAGLVGAAYAFKRGMDYSDSWWNKVSNGLGLSGGATSTSTTTTVRKTTK